MIFVRGISTAQKTVTFSPLPGVFPYSATSFVLQSFTSSKNLPVILKNRAVVSPDYYARQLGFFCRQEIKLDKVARFGFRFRLGSVAQCDMLEGKGKLW